MRQQIGSESTPGSKETEKTVTDKIHLTCTCIVKRSSKHRIVVLGEFKLSPETVAFNSLLSNTKWMLNDTFRYRCLPPN